MRPRSRAALLGVLVAALVPHTAPATVVARLGLDDLVSASQLVVTGTVVERTSEWKDGRIITKNTLVVEEALKAGEDAPAQITLVTLGGEVGDVGLWVPGESRFEVGGRYLVFARAGKEGGWSVTGMAQGNLRIIRDGSGLDWALPPQATGIVTWKNGKPVPALPFLTKPVPLEDLKCRIRELAGDEQ